jgi:hypothetical protein
VDAGGEMVGTVTVLHFMLSFVSISRRQPGTGTPGICLCSGLLTIITRFKLLQDKPLEKKPGLLQT